MAKIAEYLKQILSARYGRDVRQSIHDAISAINDESTECWATVEKVPETLAIAAVKDTVSGKDITLEMSSDFVLTDFKAWGNTEQNTTSGKNLFPIASFSGTGFVFGSSSTPYHLQLDGDFVFSANKSGSGAVSISIYDADMQTLANQQIVTTETGNIVKKFEGISGGQYINIYSNRADNVLTNMQLEVGTVATEFESFTNGASPNPDYPQEIKSVVLSNIRTCGKNLLNYSAFEYGTISATDGYTLGTSTSILYSPYFTRLKRGESYIFNIRNSIRIYKYDKDKNFIESVLLTDVFVADCDFIRYQASYFTDTSQLEVGTVATDFEPYTESIATLSNPITLNGIGGVQDYVDVKRGVLVQKLGVKVLDNTISKVTLGNMYGTSARFNIAEVITKSGNSPSLCSHFIYSKTTPNDEEYYTIHGTNYYLTVFIDSTRLSSVDVSGFKTWLASNPMTVVYELATPIETPLSEADVEVLKNIRTFKGITNIFPDSDVQPDMEVEYVIDTKMYIDKKIAELA